MPKPCALAARADAVGPAAWPCRAPKGHGPPASAPAENGVGWMAGLDDQLPSGVLPGPPCRDRENDGRRGRREGGGYSSADVESTGTSRRLPRLSAGTEAVADGELILDRSGLLNSFRAGLVCFLPKVSGYLRACVHTRKSFKKLLYSIRVHPVKVGTTMVQV